MADKIDLYFHDYKLTIEVDELAHNDININYEIEIEREKTLEKELGCEAIKINSKKFSVLKLSIKFEDT